jgi:hypothetical protein
MSDTQDGGGPAFPATPEQDAQGFCGMSLRDYFAGQALAGLRAARLQTGGAYPSENKLWSSGECARLAYRDADAMLKARKR